MDTRFRLRVSWLPPLWQAMAVLWDAARGWALAWTVLVLVQGALPVLPVYLTRPLVNHLVAAKESGGSLKSFGPALIIASIIAASLVLTVVLQSAADWIRTALSEQVQDYVSGLVHAKSIQVDVGFYDAAEYHDRLHRARSEARTRLMGLLESVGGLARNGITLLAMAGLLLPYGFWLPLALVVGTLPAFVVVVRHNQRFHTWWERTTPDRRLTDYYDTMMTHPLAAPELRLFGLGDHFSTAYQTLRQRRRGERLDLSRDESLSRLGAGAAALAVSGLSMAYMAVRVISGAATLGDLALFYQAFNQGQGLLRSLLTSVGDIHVSSLHLGDLFDFLSLQPRVVDPLEPVPTPAALEHGVSFRHVTFRYPGTERPVLEDFSLDLPAGRATAIVGANGAGKSTLVKLLCRFYDPEAGSVNLDGIDLRDLSLEQLRRRITVLFQSPMTYCTTAGQNIAMGDLPAAPTPVQIEAAARAAGAHEIITRLPRGYDTLLGKAFADGTDLSGGEWQRVALARAFLRQAPIVVLDEPTSFMDSWAEAEFLERFRDLVRGRTVLIITHRFTTAKHADVIHVMRHGKIVESGSHNELVDLGGSYARSWATQVDHAQGLTAASA